MEQRSAALVFAQPEIRLITSAKGGVGKSTVCANLGAALALRGKRVLLVDCDVANRCLDLMLGLQDRAIFGIRDIMSGDISAADAVYACPALPNLHLIPGSRFDEEAPDPAQALPALIKEAALGDYDHIFIDTPGGMHSILAAAAGCVSEALIVSSAQTTAIRSAQAAAALVAQHGTPSQRLIINQFMAADAFMPRHAKRRSILRFPDRRSPKKRQNDASVTLVETVDTLGLSLLGVIPFDASLWDAQNKGLLLCDPALADTFFAKAHRNIAARLCHFSVPLFADR